MPRRVHKKRLNIKEITRLLAPPKEPSDEFLKYLMVLHKGSINFKILVQVLRTKYSCYKPKSPKDARRLDHNSVISLMKEFLIPTQNDLYVERVKNYIYYGKVFDQYRAIYATTPSYESPESVKLYQPCTVVIINEKIGFRDWKRIWDERIKDGHKIIVEEIETDNLTPKVLDKPHSKVKKRPTIDLKLGIYKEHLNNSSPIRILNKMTEIRQRANSPSKTSYSKEEIGEIIKEFDTLITPL
jgi:hypothetical protein